MGRTLVIGDLRGNFKGFKQALERCNFDYNNDTLISLGDGKELYPEFKGR